MLCAASGIVRSKPGLDCVWVLVSHLDAGSARGGVQCCRAPSRCSDVVTTFVEAAGGSECSGSPPVRSNGGDGKGCRLTPRAVALEGDGARGAARLGRRSALAIPRGFSRTGSLRGPDGIKRVSPVNKRVQESGPADAPRSGGETARRRSTALVEPLARGPQRAGKPLGRGIQCWKNRSRVARSGSRLDEEYSVGRPLVRRPQLTMTPDG